MIDAAKAGVQFTANPINGRRDEILISATYGVGEGLVSGRVEADEIVLDREGKILNYQVSSEPILCRKSKVNLSGVEYEKFPVDSKKEKNVLLPEEIELLFVVGQEIHRHYKIPQDIEWCFKAGKLYVLQSRPITVVTSASNNNYVFDNSNIQESYCGVTTPLTFSYASKAYARVYERTMEVMGFTKADIEKSRWRHEHLLGYVQGRVYYNINHWYEGLLFLPNFGRSKESMEQMMGLEQPVDFVVDDAPQGWSRLRRVLPMTKLVFRLLWKFRTIDKEVSRFDQWFWKFYQSADRNSLSQKTPIEILEGLKWVQEESLVEWAIPIVNDFLVMIKSGSVRKTLAKLGIESEFERLISGQEIESLKPTTELQLLAFEVVNDPALYQLVTQFFDKELERKLAYSYPEFYRKCLSYIELYGDRCMGELKLETRTMREDTKIFYDLLNSFVSVISEKSNKPINDFKLDTSYLEATFKKIKDTKGQLSKMLFTRQLNQLKKSISHRELLRFHRSRVFGLVRSYYRELGRRLQELGSLSLLEDIFYLTQEEIQDYFYGRSIHSQLMDLVSLRKQEETVWKSFKSPQQQKIQTPVGFYQYKVAEVKSEFTNKNCFIGKPCSGGEIFGEVKWVQGPDDIKGLSGKILLAERTDPGWTPLFSLVNGVIIERGSALSHSAIIARELGIPAIVGVPNLGNLLNTGDKVRINGYTGEITIIERASQKTENFKIFDIDDKQIGFTEARGYDT